mgnify:CR=1 FL=1
MKRRATARKRSRRPVERVGMGRLILLKIELPDGRKRTWNFHERPVLSFDYVARDASGKGRRARLFVDCGDYRVTFDSLAAEFRLQARFVWIDIEDDADALGEVDVVDFPTLMLSRGDSIGFFGPVLPHAQTARQLLQRALQGQLAQVKDASLAGLPQRIGALR